MTCNKTIPHYTQVKQNTNSNTADIAYLPMTSQAQTLFRLKLQDEHLPSSSYRLFSSEDPTKPSLDRIHRRSPAFHLRQDMSIRY